MKILSAKDLSHNLIFSILLKLFGIENQLMNSIDHAAAVIPTVPKANKKLVNIFLPI